MRKEEIVPCTCRTHIIQVKDLAKDIKVEETLVKKWQVDFLPE